MQSSEQIDDVLDLLDELESSEEISYEAYVMLFDAIADLQSDEESYIIKVSSDFLPDSFYTGGNAKVTSVGVKEKAKHFSDYAEAFRVANDLNKAGKGNHSLSKSVYTVERV